jgi:hypothetical protein
MREIELMAEADRRAGISVRKQTLSHQAAGDGLVFAVPSGGHFVCRMARGKKLQFGAPSWLSLS